MTQLKDLLSPEQKKMLESFPLKRNPQAFRYKNQSRHAKRFRKWYKQPFCVWCKRKTIWIKNNKLNQQPIPRDAATFDHINFRWDRKRETPNDINERRLQTACYQCNHKRGIFDLWRQPLYKLIRFYKPTRILKNKLIWWYHILVTGHFDRFIVKEDYPIEPFN